MINKTITNSSIFINNLIKYHIIWWVYRIWSGSFRISCISSGHSNTINFYIIIIKYNLAILCSICYSIWKICIKKFSFTTSMSRNKFINNRGVITSKAMPRYKAIIMSTSQISSISRVSRRSIKNTSPRTKRSSISYFARSSYLRTCSKYRTIRNISCLLSFHLFWGGMHIPFTTRTRICK